jgi:transposase
MLLVVVTAWLDRREREVLAYLIEENGALRRLLGGRRLRGTEDDRRRLALRAYRLRRQGLCEVATIVTPETLLHSAPRGHRFADNLGAHKVAGVRRAIARADATLWHLPPPYSPDLNPIELCLAKLTTIVRAARCRSIETLWPPLGDCLQRFSAAECRHYFQHCGYSGAKRL